MVEIQVVGMLARGMVGPTRITVGLSPFGYEYIIDDMRSANHVLQSSVRQPDSKRKQCWGSARPIGPKLKFEGVLL